jgi:hypothetical protein
MEKKFYRGLALRPLRPLPCLRSGGIYNKTKKYNARAQMKSKIHTFLINVFLYFKLPIPLSLSLFLTHAHA